MSKYQESGMNLIGSGLTDRTKTELHHVGAVHRPDLGYWKISKPQWDELSQLSKDEVRHVRCLEDAAERLRTAQTDLKYQTEALALTRERIENLAELAHVPIERKTKTPRPVTKIEIAEFKHNRMLDEKAKDDALAAAMAALAALKQSQ